MKIKAFLLLVIFLIQGCSSRALPPPEVIPGVFGFKSSWPHGLIYYDFDDSVDKKCREKILEAMDVWEESRVIKFIRRSKDTRNYALIRKGGLIGSSAVGMMGGEQSLVITQNCSYSIVAHELGHLIGLHHEHQRWDRDQYVKVNWLNVQLLSIPQFTKISYPEYPILTPFDYDSVMLYSSYTFSSSGPTLEKTHGELISPTREITPYDLLKVVEIYTSIH